MDSDTQGGEHAAVFTPRDLSPLDLEGLSAAFAVVLPQAPAAFDTHSHVLMIFSLLITNTAGLVVRSRDFVRPPLPVNSCPLCIEPPLISVYTTAMSQILTAGQAGEL